MIRALIFDIGNVLVTFDFNRAASRILPYCDLPDGYPAEEVETLKQAYEGGAIGREEFLAKVFEAVKYRGTPEFFVKAWQEIFEENRPMTAFVQKLQGRRPLYLLSNTSDIHMDYIFAEYPIFRCFQDGIYSYDVRLSKPDPAIFRLAVERFGVKPEETLYIDDMEANIRSAREVGFETIQYDLRNHAAFEAAVERLGLLSGC